MLQNIQRVVVVVVLLMNLLFTFALHQVDKVCCVSVTGELLLHAEASDIFDFLHVRKVLVFIVHPPADGALPLKKEEEEKDNIVIYANAKYSGEFAED